MSAGNPIRLLRIAHARSGDKGNHANIGVIAHTPAGYDFLLRELTAQRVATFFAGLGGSRVERFELPKIAALNFLLYDCLGGGASRSEDHYRPRARRKERRREPPPFSARSVVRRAALAEMRDALTGGTLDADGELFRCADCQSFYTVQSVRALANDNGARCINCGSIHRIGVEVVD